jgi:signal transduction histidine kinase
MLKHTLAVQGTERRRRAMLLTANALGALGGGGTILLNVLQVTSIAAAVPFLFGSIALATWSVLADETGRHGEFLRQGLWYAVVTASLSAIGLSVFYFALPWLTPLSADGRSWPWVLWICFIAALPLDSARQWVVDGLARRFFARPMSVRSLATELERSEERAVHAEQLAELGRVASVVAHEVRNPLGVILAQTKLLEREGVDPARIADVRAQIARASKFVDELLRYAKPRAFQVTRVEVKVAIDLAISNVRQALATTVPMNAPATSASLEVDQQALVDALVVLLSNAAIALEGTADGCIEVTVREEVGRLVISVEDNGPGVPPELASRLFELFATGRGRDHAHPGVGLGLAIARQHAVRHGGTLRHEVRAPHGARFVLTLPVTAR